jgi:hypothetical protein
VLKAADDSSFDIFRTIDHRKMEQVDPPSKMTSLERIEENPSPAGDYVEDATESHRNLKMAQHR